MCFSQRNPLSGARPAERSRHQQSIGQSMEVEASSEAIGNGTEVALGVLVEAEAVVGTAEAGLKIAEDGIDPVEHRQVLGFARSDDGRLMGTAGIGDAGEAGQTIGDDSAVRTEVIAVRVKPVSCVNFARSG